MRCLSGQDNAIYFRELYSSASPSFFSQFSFHSLTSCCILNCLCDSNDNASVPREQLSSVKTLSTELLEMCWNK